MEEQGEGEGGDSCSAVEVEGEEGEGGKLSSAVEEVKPWPELGEEGERERGDLAIWRFAGEGWSCGGG